MDGGWKWRLKASKREEWTVTVNEVEVLQGL
jgi:hypothetical protein